MTNLLHYRHMTANTWCTKQHRTTPLIVMPYSMSAWHLGNAFLCLCNIFYHKAKKQSPWNSLKIFKAQFTPTWSIPFNSDWPLTGRLRMWVFCPLSLGATPLTPCGPCNHLTAPSFSTSTLHYISPSLQRGDSWNKISSCCGTFFFFPNKCEWQCEDDNMRCLHPQNSSSAPWQPLDRQSRRYCIFWWSKA